MTRTIGIGVIGMGWMGEVHSRSYRAMPVIAISIPPGDSTWAMMISK